MRKTQEKMMMRCNTLSSARKCKKEFVKGYLIDVWNGNTLVDAIYSRNLDDINKYVRLEKEHIARKQKLAEERNKRRKMKLEKRAVRLNGHTEDSETA